MTDAGSPRQGDEAQVVISVSFEELADEWDELALRTGAPPFARPGWVRAWWSAFGKGEPCILTSRRDGELCAVLPLARHRGAMRTCSNIHSPLFDGISADIESLQALLTAGLRESRQGLIMGDLEAEGRLIAASRQLANQSRCRLTVLEEKTFRYIDPAMSWEEYEQSLRKSRRQELRRRRRRLSEQGEIDFEIVDGTRDLEACLEEFLRLESSGWKGDEGTAIRAMPKTQRFYEDVAAWAAENGLLRLSFMRVGDVYVAANLTIDDGVHRYPLKVGYDDQYSRYAPGLLHWLEEIERALDDGRTVELATGTEAFKEELQNAQRTIERVAVFPPSARGELARRTLEARQAAYRRARDSTLLRGARDTGRRILMRRRAGSTDAPRTSESRQSGE
jgi:CelD/BcsL family acetyltransferase involved in cellulose biosynthesis